MLDSNRAGARFKTSSIEPNRALTLKHQTESSRPLSLIRPIRADPSARIVCIDCHLCTDAQKCKKLPRYCVKDIGDAIQKLDGYVEVDWTVFQRELKRLFWQADPPKDTVAALFKLISDTKAGKMNVDMYVLKYMTITDALIRKNAMSKFDRAVRLLEGLSDETQSKVF